MGYETKLAGCCGKEQVEVYLQDMGEPGSSVSEVEMTDKVGEMECGDEAEDEESKGGQSSQWMHDGCWAFSACSACRAQANCSGCTKADTPLVGG